MSNRGFTAFFAVLVSSLTLAVGISIFDLLSRELELSQTAAQSQFAIFAADTAAECALYWDMHYSNGSTNDHGGSKSAFATTTIGSPYDQLSVGSGSNLFCDTLDISMNPPPAVDWSQYTNSTYGCPSTRGNAWCVVTDDVSHLAATTTFSISIPTAKQTYCATVVVAKYASPGNPSRTSITSHGFNTCSATGITRLERTLQVNY
jgi:hypothetical protein